MISNEISFSALKLASVPFRLLLYNFFVAAEFPRVKIRNT